MNSTDIDELQQIVAGAIGSHDGGRPQSVDAGMAAVITVEHDRRYLSATLTAVFGQRVLPAVIVVADCTGAVKHPLQSSFEFTPAMQDGLITPSAERYDVTVRLVGVDKAASFSDAVRKAVRVARVNDNVRGLWMLHDDARPADERCFEHLLETWRNAPSATVLGCKQLDWDGSALHDVGSYAGRHRIASLVVDGEPDQEQYDGRSDVYAVSLAGALVSMAALRTFEWPDPWFGTYRESADFCRRVCLGGGRVVVVPAARIAHRRARFEGVRSHAGKPIDDEMPANTTMERMRAGQRYRYTDMHRTRWLWAWLFSVLSSLGAFARLLFSKQPYEAWCALRLPWLAPAGLVPALRARRRIRRLAVLGIGRLPMLVASRRQIASWRERDEALRSQRGTRILSPLERAHLRRRRIRRGSAAVGMMAVAIVALALRYREVLSGVWSGGSLSSGLLLPTSAGFGQLLRSATTPWVFGMSAGIPAPPTPWLLVWLGAGVVTLGHVAAALPMLYVLSAPLSALSFWALVGVFTRSDAIRVVCGLLWTALAFGLGLYDTANLAMLTVMMFLPAAFAFAFRAVGMYHTEDLVAPRSSVQAAGCSALCFVPAVAAEPQLFLPLVAAFLVFLVLVPRHRATLLLIPVPSAFVVAPTLVNAVRYGSLGLWRQLFGDIAVPRTSVNGAPRSLNLADIVARVALPVGRGTGSVRGWAEWLGVASIAGLLVVVVLAVLSLMLPFALRVSRMMWTVVVAGGVLAMVSSRVVIAVDADGPVAGSVQPGVCLAMLGLLCCASQVAGDAVARYRPLALPMSERDEVRAGSAGRRLVLVRGARAGLTALLAVCAVAWAALGLMGGTAQSVAAGSRGLPMVAVDYLQKNPAHRILAVRASSRTAVSYTVMRTAKGDLVDASPAQRAQFASGMRDAHGDRLALSAARLLAHADADAIDDIASLGFGGIYVVGSAEDPASDAAERDAAMELSTNITTSEGVQSVVSGTAGTYYRVTAISDNARLGVDTRRQLTMQTSAWRYAWLWCLALVMLMYCLVAIPRGYHTAEEES